MVKKKQSFALLQRISCIIHVDGYISLLHYVHYISFFFSLSLFIDSSTI
jgi:hypothetical protein